MAKFDYKLLLKCGVAFLLQILSLIFKPFVFLELAYLLGLIIFDKFENKICYLFFMLPFYNVFRYSAEATDFNQIVSSFGSIYFSIFLVLCFCCVMFVKYLIDLKNKNKSIKIKPLVIWVFFYISFLLPFREFNASTISSFLVISSLFASLYLIFEYKDKWNLKKILNVWLVGVVLSVVLYCMKNILPHLNSFLVVFENRRFFIQRDPNYWAFELLTLLCGYTILLVKQKEKVLYSISLILVSVLGFITYSKSFYISFAVYAFIMIALLLSNMVKKVRKKDLKKVYLIFTIALILIALMVLILNFKNIINFISSQRKHLFDDKSADIIGKIDGVTTGRLDIWLTYLKNIVFSPITFVFGRGCLSGYEGAAIHNTPIQMLYFCGVPTVSVLLVVLFMLFKKHKKKINVTTLIPVIVLGLFSCSLDLLFSYRTYLILTMFILAFNNETVTLSKAIDDKVMTCYSEEDYKNQSVLLSVIIPIYNVENYLQKCVESICKQNLIKTEILLIDDGATDKSGEIADLLAKRYDNVSVYHKPNGGLSDARNYGIKQAKGKYLCFIDSDDYVEKNFTDIYNYLNKDADIVFCGYIAEYVKQSKIIKYENNEYIVGNDAVLEKCLDICTNKNSACVKVVKKEFVVNNNLYFEKGFSEDFNWLGRVCCHLQSAIKCDLVYYHYIAEREGSLMNTFKKSKFYDVIEHAKSILAEIKKIKLSKKSELKIRQYIGFNILSIFRNIRFLDKYEKQEVIKLLKDNYDLIKHQKSFIMKMFLLFAKVFGFEMAYKLVK